MNENRDTFKEILLKIPFHIRCCLVSGILWGIITHAYMLTNKLPNWDDINNVGGYAVGSEFGRWFLKYVNPLDGIWSVPWLSGIFSIVLISAAACFVLSTLHLKSTTSAVLIPLMMLSFPSMCSLFTFMFTADCYAVGILLACAGAWLIRKYRFGFLPGIVCLVLSMGIYQAYLCLALGILVMGLFLDMLEENSRTADVFLRGVKAFVVACISVVIYTIVSRIVYPQLDAYNGLDQMGKIDLIRLPRLILRSYKWVVQYFILKPFSFVTAAAWALNVASCLLTAGLVIAFFIRKKIYKDSGSAILYIFLAMMVPLAMGSIIIMATDASISMLMLYQYHILYTFLAALLEKSQDTQSGLFLADAGKVRAGRILGYVVAAVLLLVGYQNFVVTNQAYFRMGIAYERSYAYYNRIMERIEATAGYQPGDPFALIGEYGLSETPDLLGSYSMDGDRFTDLSGVAKETGLLTSGVRYNFMKTYIGVEMPEVSEEAVEAIKETKEYQEMPAYPADGCVKQIEGVWVVKTCEETKG